MSGEALDLDAMKAKYDRLAEEGVIEQETHSDVMQLLTMLRQWHDWFTGANE